MFVGRSIWAPLNTGGVLYSLLFFPIVNAGLIPFSFEHSWGHCYRVIRFQPAQSTCVLET
jgi:hypothetical protein